MGRLDMTRGASGTEELTFCHDSHPRAALRDATHDSYRPPAQAKREKRKLARGTLTFFRNDKILSRCERRKDICDCVYWTCVPTIRACRVLPTVQSRSRSHPTCTCHHARGMMLAARIALTAVSVAQTHSELYPGLATLAASEPELHGNDGFFLEAADSADSDGDGATVCTMLRAHLRLFPWQAHVWARLGVCQVKADVPLVATRRSEAHPLRMSRQAAEACADLDGEPLPLTRQAAFDLYTSAAEEQGPAPARASCATTPVERRALERLRESEAALELAEWLGGAASATAAREAVLSLLAPPRLCATDAQALADGGTALVRAAIAALADPDRLTAPGGPFRKLCTVPNLVVRVEGSVSKGPTSASNTERESTK